MSTEVTTPKTLQEAILYYSNTDRCLEILTACRWADGVVVCPYCQFKGCTFMASVTRWQCKNKACRKQFSIKVGTYMEDSPIGLDKWLMAMWLIGNAKNGISSCEVARAIGITQKSAWFMLHRIRLSFGDAQTADFIGTVEADETYIGGLEKNKHASKKKAGTQGRSTESKAIVFGLLERGNGAQCSKANATVIENASGKTLKSKIKTHVTPGTEVFTDNWTGYKGMPAAYIHAYVDHAVEYVNGRVHTNGLENFFSLLKRTVKGTYVAVSPWHLQSYVEEQTFRFNERTGKDADRFLKTVQGVQGKRLTYKQLTELSWA